MMMMKLYGNLFIRLIFVLNQNKNNYLMNYFGKGLYQFQILLFSFLIYFMNLFSRYQLAKLCGYSSYSHRALDTTLLNKPEYVTSYLEQIMNAIRPLADRDIQLMQILKNRLPSASMNQSVAPWDVARLEAKFKSEMYEMKCRMRIENLFYFV